MIASSCPAAAGVAVDDCGVGALAANEVASTAASAARTDTHRRVFTAARAKFRDNSREVCGEVLWTVMANPRTFDARDHGSSRRPSTPGRRYFVGPTREPSSAAKSTDHTSPACSVAAPAAQPSRTLSVCATWNSTGEVTLFTS